MLSVAIKSGHLTEMHKMTGEKSDCELRPKHEVLTKLIVGTSKQSIAKKRLYLSIRLDII